jgi:hypothetical protein
MLVYLTHVYSRLVHTPPIYVTTSSKSENTVDENEKNAAKKSFVLHRRHLPLTKKIEVSKLYPHLITFISPTSTLEGYLIALNSANEFLGLLLFKHRSNKAPPFIC